jgi:hypothetical protein
MAQLFHTDRYSLARRAARYIVVDGDLEPGESKSRLEHLGDFRSGSVLLGNKTAVLRDGTDCY